MWDATWAQAAATAFLGFVGLWLAHGYRRQMGLRLAERQVDAYKALWTAMSAVEPGRLAPLDRAEREELNIQMRRWFFDEGNGVLLSTAAHELFVAVKSNLTCRVADIRPLTLAAQLGQFAETDAELQRGCVIIRQAGLLRMQLKADLSLHQGLSLYRGVRPMERDFLRSCGLSPWFGPWRPRRWSGRRLIPRRLQTTYTSFTDLCVCKQCR